MGPAAIPILTELLKDKECKVRCSAAFVLERIVGECPKTRSGPQAKKTIAALTESLKDSDGGACANAAMALGYIGSEAASAIPALCDSLKDKDTHVRSNAAYAIGNMGVNARASVSSISDLLRDTDFEVRRSAKEALARLGETAIPTLVGLLRDEDHKLRVRAVEVLGMMGPKANAAVPKLTELLGDKAVDVRWAAEEALEKIKAEKNKAYGSVP